ncbi:hypothetical protein TeGR_g13717 [Tetraparma gracilis]|uniref:Orc1-like AAA ATPase domain-containing protein n=1 Tax=Tetraparma gracilis TaxID=2962635 RepID=A0ABQ6MR61_9STRA|nr:hypothetical protein TeGR_g13717 [Tetraparma gracilis]
MSLAHGGCHQSSIIAAAFTISNATNPRATLGQFRAILDTLAKKFGEHGGGMMSSTTSSNSLQIMGWLPIPITSAAFFVSKVSGRFRHSSRQPRVDKKGKLEPRAILSACVIHFGDVLWRAGVGGSVIPFGPEVDELTAQLQLLLGDSKGTDVSGGGDGNDSDDDQPPASIYCKASVIQEQLELTGESRLIKFTDSTEHPDWMVPQDVFTDAVKTVFEGSEMAGRSDTRKALSHALSDLLLINASSTTLLEARAGFGKSMLANEIVQVASTLNIPHYIARASEDNESNLRVWIELCASLLRTAENSNGGADVDLLGHLPSGCGTTELYWLNDYLPTKYRVTESMLRAEQNDDSDDYDDLGKHLLEESFAGTANTSVKLQLFGSILHSLALQVAPFVFVIEDLQWLDSSSWKMLVQSEYWTHGLMMVCTTRPVPLHVADHYTSVCKAPATARVTLGPLDAADLTSLARRHLASVDMGSVSASMMVIDRLVKLSQGFPFLAEELLMEAKADFASSLLGSAKPPDELKDTGSTNERTIAKDTYTPEELLSLNEFYSNYKRNAGWELLTVEGGVEYFSRPNDTGTIRQGKAVAIIPNCTPHDVEEISEQLLKLVESRTGGNLLYIQELVSSLIESGMLKYNDKSVDLKSDVDDLVVPDNVQAVIASRLAGLTTSQQSILQTASVIGRTFTLGMVTEVHPASEMLQNLAGDLKEIVRKRIVERIVGSGGGDDTDGELQFSHKFVQESIYESCLVSNRKQVHRAIAKHLELDQSKQLGDSYALIAHHYVQAEEWRNACLYLQLSSEVSARLEMPGAVVASLTQWKKIREEKLTKTGDSLVVAKLGSRSGREEAINGRFGSAGKEAGIVYITLGHALKTMMRKDEALEMYALGAESLGRSFPESKLAKVRIIVRGLALLQWMAVKGGTYKTVDKASEEEVLLAEAIGASAEIFFREKNDKLGFFSVTLMMLVSTSRPTAMMVKFGAQFGSFAAPLLGLTKVSDHLTMEVNRLASQCTGNDGVVASAYLNFTNGMAYGGKGELRQAAGFFTAAARASLELRDFAEWANNVAYAHQMSFENGNLAQVLEASYSGLRKAEETGSAIAVRHFGSLLSKLTVHAGKDDSAKALSLLKLLEKEPRGDPVATLFLKWNMEELNADECAKAIERRIELDKFSQTYLNQSQVSGIVCALLQLYDYAQAAGVEALGGVKTAKLLEMVDSKISWMEKLARKYPIASGWALAQRGAVLARTGKRGAAMKLLEKAEEASLKISGRACLCYVHLERGYLEDGALAASSGSLSGSSTAKAAVVSPAVGAEEGNCTKSFAAAADLADETGMHRLGDLAKERLRRLNVDTSSMVVGVRAPETGRMASGLRSIGRTVSGRSMRNTGLNATLIVNASEKVKGLALVQSGRLMSRKGSAVGFQDDGGKK